MAEKQNTYWTPVIGPDEQRPPTMGCPRECGSYMVGTEDGPLIHWRCINSECGYNIHS